MTIHVRDALLDAIEYGDAPQDAARVSAHLDVCAVCRDFARDLQRNDARLRDQPPPLPLPPVPSNRRVPTTRVFGVGGMAAAATAVAVAIVVITVLGVRAPVATPGSPEASATAPSSPSATLPSTRPASRSVQTTSVASIPRDFVYVEASPARDVNLWLVDLSGATPPASVARWTSGSNTFSASRDGKTVIIAAPGERSIIGLHLLHPLTGEATVLFEGPADGRVFSPKLSPDGSRFAFLLMRQQGGDGIWVGDVSTGSVRRVYAPLREDPTLLGWSDDGQWLTFSAPDEADLSGGPHIFLQNITDGRRLNAGTGSLVSWRAREPRVLIALVGGKGNQGAFGAMVYTFDLATQRRIEQLSIDPRVEAVSWNPTRDELLYLPSDSGCDFQAAIWVRSVGANDARRIGNIGTAHAAWWSTDGGTIYALAANGTDGVIVNATSGNRVATIPEAGARRPCP